MIRIVLIAVLSLSLGAIAGCAGAEPTQLPASVSTRRVESADQIAKRLDLTLTGSRESIAATIPLTLDDAEWRPLQTAALQGGYDLRPFVGKPVSLRSFGIREESEGHRQTLWLIESGSRVIGTYIVVDDVVPGVLGVGNPS